MENQNKELLDALLGGGIGGKEDDIINDEMISEINNVMNSAESIEIYGIENTYEIDPVTFNWEEAVKNVDNFKNNAKVLHETQNKIFLKTDNEEISLCISTLINYLSDFDIRPSYAMAEDIDDFKKAAMLVADALSVTTTLLHNIEIYSVISALTDAPSSDIDQLLESLNSIVDSEVSDVEYSTYRVCGKMSAAGDEKDIIITSINVVDTDDVDVEEYYIPNINSCGEYTMVVAAANEGVARDIAHNILYNNYCCNDDIEATLDVSETDEVGD